MSVGSATPAVAVPLALGHAGLSVGEMDRSLRFYESGLGLDCVSRRVVDDEYILRIVQVPVATAIEVAMLSTADGRIAVELLRYLGTEASERLGQPDPSTPGVGHLCLFVADAAVAAERALAAGGTRRSPEPVQIESGPYAGGFGFYLSDPDGYSVELVEASAQIRNQLEIDRRSR